MRKSVMTHNFSRIPESNIPRSSFDRSHGYKTTFDAGQLIPIYVDEVLPGDTFKLKTTAFARMSTPIFPLMDNMFLDIHYFFIPYRLVWDNFQKAMGERDDPDDSIDFTVPQQTVPENGFETGSLADYMGIPAGVENFTFSALPFRAYQKVWNDWYRAQDIQANETFSKGDGPDTVNISVFYRNKRHDYFTSCLPYPQKGDAVTLPLGTSAPVTGIGSSVGTFGGTGVSVYETDGTGLRAYTASEQLGSLWHAEEDPNNAGFPNIRADLTSATAATINELRTAFQVQKLLERDARSGTRYTEIVKAHFGTDSADARLQRSEFLGGGSARVNLTPIAQTSSTDATTPQGNLAAIGTIAMDQAGFTKSFTEHGVLLGLASVRADLTYQQGLPREWSRLTRYDFYWPSLAHLGEQATLNKEIYVSGNIETDNSVFGYQERYAEYRYKQSQITGKFRSNLHLSTGSLDSWHLSQDFSSTPLLNGGFIREDPPMARVLAIQTEPHFLFDSFHDLTCVRPMPVYSVPGLIDHF